MTLELLAEMAELPAGAVMLTPMGAIHLVALETDTFVKVILLLKCQTETNRLNAGQWHLDHCEDHDFTSH